MSTLVNSFLAENEKIKAKQKITWEVPLNYKNSDTADLKIINIKILSNENLIAVIKNVSLFSNWQREIEIPRTEIDMYFDSEIWNRHLKKSILKWLEAHSQFERQNSMLFFQITN